MDRQSAKDRGLYSVLAVGRLLKCSFKWLVKCDKLPRPTRQYGKRYYYNKDDIKELRKLLRKLPKLVCMTSIAVQGDINWMTLDKYIAAGLVLEPKFTIGKGKCGRRHRAWRAGEVRTVLRQVREARALSAAERKIIIAKKQQQP